MSSSSSNANVQDAASESKRAIQWVGGFCREDGAEIFPNAAVFENKQSMMAEGEGNDSFVPTFEVPPLASSQYASNLSLFAPPRSWIKHHGIQANTRLPINIPELEVMGLAFVNSVEVCPEIAVGEGSVITGRFLTRQVDEIARVEIRGADGTIETLEGTTIHPIWSVDRNDWVPLGELEEGERLQGHAGPAIVLGHAIRCGLISVYNVEVYGEHVYEVGEIGLLTQNTCTVIGRMDDLKAFDGIPADVIDTWRKSGRIPRNMDDQVTWAENLAWLKERIARGDIFGLATDPHNLPPLVNGRIPGVSNGYFTTKKLAFLRKSGIDVLDLGAGNYVKRISTA